MELERLARAALFGVGDRTKEWLEWTGRAFHVRRRLTEDEEALVGPASDLRGKPQAMERLKAAWPTLPAPLMRMALEEVKTCAVASS